MKQTLGALIGITVNAYWYPCISGGTEKDYIRSGTSIPKSDIPFLIVNATFFESNRRKSRRALFSSFRMG